MNIFNTINNYIDIILNSLGIYGPLLGCFLICVESILPFLPLSAFITLNFIAFGNLWGFLISWFFTILGCMLSFTLCRKKIKGWVDKKRKDKKKLNKIMKNIEKINFSGLVTIIAIPFTPAFLVNIAAGLTKMSYKRFLFALIIGKMFLVYFWGFIGVSLIESLNHPIVLVKTGVLLLIAYIISRVVSHRFNLD